MPSSRTTAIPRNTGIGTSMIFPQTQSPSAAHYLALPLPKHVSLSFFISIRLYLFPAFADTSITRQKHGFYWRKSPGNVSTRFGPTILRCKSFLLHGRFADTSVNSVRPLQRIVGVMSLGQCRTNLRSATERDIFFHSDQQVLSCPPRGL
ncbi:hypothetical protein BDP27DRAFT_1319316 [Rhodocollybia butyracea]|uniref:Uncharacterized protein n=1 Tax=Rhodocollybia butyracea TaxID=206335 RepID=A0A9P5PV65_9AGAR|nr:hypothetical protein BDP27DRAFT_1319316 [Rhodocollybia butyracea]